jgi:hypothetical protein
VLSIKWSRLRCSARVASLLVARISIRSARPYVARLLERGDREHVLVGLLIGQSEHVQRRDQLARRGAARGTQFFDLLDELRLRIGRGKAAPHAMTAATRSVFVRLLIDSRKAGTSSSSRKAQGASRV